MGSETARRLGRELSSVPDRARQNCYATQAILLVETINTDAFTVFRIMLQIRFAFGFGENCHKDHISLSI